MRLSARWRHLVIQALLVAAAIQTLVDLLAGPEPLGVGIIWIAFLAFALDLNGEADRRTRRWTWAFVAVGLLGLANNVLGLSTPRRAAIRAARAVLAARLRCEA